MGLGTNLKLVEDFDLDDVGSCLFDTEGKNTVPETIEAPCAVAGISKKLLSVAGLVGADGTVYDEVPFFEKKE